MKIAFKSSTRNKSFAHSQAKKSYLKTSELVNCIDSYLIQKKTYILPQLEKKIQKSFPVKPPKQVSTLYAPFQVPSEADVFLSEILSKKKRKTPVFAEMKKNYRLPGRRYFGVAKSHDDNILMQIQGISEARPKSVMNKKASFLMQTDELLFED